MEPTLLFPLVILLLLGVLFTGVWIFAGLLFVALFSLTVLAGMPLERVGRIATTMMLRSAGSWEMGAIPMFIWMGELVIVSNMSERMFRGLKPLVRSFPGGLLHTNVAGCTLFACVSGSSVATTASIGKITLPRLQSEGYPRHLAVGSLAGAGSFGLLIPPSISLIIYGMQAEVSISALFMAGLVPGLMLGVLYSLYIAGSSLLTGGTRPGGGGGRPTLRELRQSAADLLPIMILIVGVIGAIYSGVATPSEAAAVGVTVTLIYALITGNLTAGSFVRSIVAAAMTSCTLMIMVVTAAVLATAMGYLHLPQHASELVVSLDPEPWQLLLLVGVFYILLGMVLDGNSIILTSLPLVLPAVVGTAGFDPIWFGIFLVIAIEMGTMTPPVGFNLFVIRSITGLPLMVISRYALPFFGLMVFALVLISVYPSIALWLPGH